MQSLATDNQITRKVAPLSSDFSIITSGYISENLTSKIIAELMNIG